MKNKLLEIDYDQIFSPKTLQTLKGKSGESLRQMLGGPLNPNRLRQVMMDNINLLNQISEVEEPYRDLLEQLAVQMVEEAYPIISYAGIKIDAEITKGEIGISNHEPESNEVSIEDADIPDKIKRRVINGITQGASVRGSFGFLLFREYLDKIDDSLVTKYGEILKLTFGTYDSEEAIAMMLMMLAQGKKIEGGSSEAKYNQEKDQFTIKATAINFPFLVHEIIKGLYEILSLQGFGTDLEKNKQIVQKVDKTSNEPRDLQYGKFIYDAVSDLYNNSNFDDPRIREFLFTEIYKLPDEQFLSFIENAINGELTSKQKIWAIDIMKDISSDLKKDDTNLDDLL